MEVLTKCVILDDEKFVLIKDKSEKLTEFYKNGEFYGTIPYAELDEHGKLKRQLNGFEIGIEASAGEALRSRLIQIRLKKYTEANPNATKEMLIEKAIELSNAIK